MHSELIFVYGTLRKETGTAMHYVLARDCEYLSEAYIQGKLYEVNGYPGFIESDSQKDQVTGELYKLVDQHSVLAKLDEYEECSEQFPKPHEYVRKKLPVTLVNGRTVSAWVYVFNYDGFSPRTHFIG